MIGALVRLSGEPHADAIRNAVVVLDRLGLPDAPVGQNVQNLPGMSRTINYVAANIKEELEAVASLSRGAVRISLALKQFFAAHDAQWEFFRSPPEGRKIGSLFWRHFDFGATEFFYFVQGSQVVLCTREEAAARWQAWWARNEKALRYDSEKHVFVLDKRR